ncbi:hypothetical protein QFC20_003232 [Naganishia adeliensis]|uniref:Uncharacterized protein n=1 Tax=Naganishia adeliensis TaxID=92952 RepID=A0ACC2WFI0_9TREE|nr:hypothetical protein QFC20_003232 [Naganishia adeliensis]
MSSNTQCLQPRYFEPVDYVDGNLRTEVESLLRSGMYPNSADEHDIKEMGNAIRSAFGEHTELAKDLYKAQVSSVRDLDEAVVSSIHALSALFSIELQSEQATLTFPETPPGSHRGATGELELAVYVKINDDALHDEEYTSTVVTAKRVAKKLSQEVLKSLIAEDPTLKANFIESDYLHDALCAAVQIVLYSPLNELKPVRPGSEQLLSKLKWKNHRDWFMDVREVRAILANSAGEMDALLNVVKLFLHAETDGM